MNDLQDLIATNAIRAYNEGFERGEASERERIRKLLKQLESEWKGCLSYYIEVDNSYEISRYRNYILACADLRDMVQDPDALIKGEQK